MLFLMWIRRNEWKCNIWPVHCSANMSKGSCAQVACDTVVFPAPQLWVVSAIRCYMRETKPLVSFLCAAFCYAYFKGVEAHWDSSGNKRTGKFKNIRVSVLRVVCSAEWVTSLPSEGDKGCHTNLALPSSARKSGWSFNRPCWEHECKREVHVSVVFLVRVHNIISLSSYYPITPTVMRLCHL